MELYIYLRIAENDIEKCQIFDNLGKAQEEMLSDVKQHWDDNYDDDTSWQEVLDAMNAEGEFVDNDCEFSIGLLGGYSHLDSDENVDWYILRIKPGQTSGDLTWN